MSSPASNSHIANSPSDPCNNTVDVNISFNVAHEDTQPQSKLLQSVITVDTDNGSNTKQTVFSSNQHNIQTSGKKPEKQQYEKFSLKVLDYTNINKQQYTDRGDVGSYMQNSHRDLSSERSQQKMVPEKLLNLEKALAEQKQQQLQMEIDQLHEQIQKDKKNFNIVRETLQKQIMTLSSQIGDPQNSQSMQIEIQDLQSKVSSLRAKNQDLTDSNDKLTKQLDKEQNKAGTLAMDLDEVKQQFKLKEKDLLLQIESCKYDVKHNQTQYELAQIDIQELKQKQDIEFQNSLQELRSEHQIQILEQQTQFDKVLSDLRNQNSERQNQHNSSLLELKSQIEQKQARIDELENVLKFRDQEHDMEGTELGMQMFQQMCALHQKYIAEISILNKQIQNFLQDKENQVLKSKDQCDTYKAQINNLKKELQDCQKLQKKDRSSNDNLLKEYQQRIQNLQGRLSQVEKLEEANLKMQQDMLDLERENAILKKNDKGLRKEFLLRIKEMKQQNNELLKRKNRVIEDQRKRSISNNKKNRAKENVLTARIQEQIKCIDRSQSQLALNQPQIPGATSTFDMKSRLGSHLNDCVSQRSGKTNRFGTTNLMSARSNYEKNAVEVAKSKRLLEQSKHEKAMNELVNFSHLYTNTQDVRGKELSESNPTSHRGLFKKEYKSNLLALSTQNLLGVMQAEDLDQTNPNLLSKSIDSNQLSKIIRQLSNDGRPAASGNSTQRVAQSILHFKQDKDRIHEQIQKHKRRMNAGSISKSPSQPTNLKVMKASASGNISARQTQQNHLMTTEDLRSQKSRNNDLHVPKIRQAANDTNKEPQSATMTQQTPRLGNDEMRGQHSGKKGQQPSGKKNNQYNRLSLKKLEQSMPSPSRLRTEVNSGRESKYLQIEDLNSELMPNKPFDSQVSTGAGRDKILNSQVSQLPEGEHTGFNETMSKVLGFTHTQETANKPVKIAGLSIKGNQIYTNGSFLDMQLTDIKAEDSNDKEIEVRYHQMEDVPEDGSKNSSEMQFSEVEENEETHDSRPYNNLLKRSALIDPSPQISPERDQNPIMSQLTSYCNDIPASPQLELRQQKISLSNRKNHKSIDLQAKRKKNYTVQQNYQSQVSQEDGIAQEINKRPFGHHKHSNSISNQQEIELDSSEQRLQQRLKTSLGVRKSKSNVKIGGNQQVNQSMNGPIGGDNTRKSLFESNIHNNAYEEYKFQSKKQSLKQNVGPIHISDYRSNHKRKDSFNSCNNQFNNFTNYQQFNKKYGSNGNPSHPSQIYKQHFRSPQNDKRMGANNNNTVIDKTSALFSNQMESGKKQLIKNAKSPQNQETMKLVQTKNSLFKQHKSGYSKVNEINRQNSKDNNTRKGRSNNNRATMKSEREPQSTKIPRLYRNNAELLANRLGTGETNMQSSQSQNSMLHQFNQQKASNHQQNGNQS